MVVNLLLKLLWKIEIVSQGQTKKEWATIGTDPVVTGLTFRVASNCPLNVAASPTGCGRGQSCKKSDERWDEEIKSQIERRTQSIWSAIQYNPVESSTGCYQAKACRWDRWELKANEKPNVVHGQVGQQSNTLR